MNDTSSAWHCNACARLHLLGAPVSRPERCEDCGAPGLSDAGPTSGFGDLNRAGARGIEHVRALGAGQQERNATGLIAEAQRLRGEARIAGVALREALVVTSSACAASRQARADRIGVEFAEAGAGVRRSS